MPCRRISCESKSTSKPPSSVHVDDRAVPALLQAADAACYAAKDQGRNRVHVYQEDDAVVAQRHGEMQWVARVKRALNENRFLLEAQPIVSLREVGDAHASTPRAYELLLRMRDEDGPFRPIGAARSEASRLDREADPSGAALGARDQATIRALGTIVGHVRRDGNAEDCRVDGLRRLDVGVGAAEKG